MNDTKLYNIPNFIDGLNLIQHPSQIKDTEVQDISNMEVRPNSISATLSYLALTARNSYRRLHSDALLFSPRNLMQFVQSVSGGSGAGTKFLVTGGYKSSTGHFNLRYLKDGDSTTNSIYDAASTDTKILSLFASLTKLYYSDSNLAWRSWDGVTDSASGFVTKTKTGCMHKQRAFYGNDVTNGLPHYLYFSDVGLPETVQASSFYIVGAADEAIIQILDFYDRLLIIKERSTWGLFMATDPAQSTLVQMDVVKGSISPLGQQVAGFSAKVLTSDVGLQELTRDYYQVYYKPDAVQIYNYLKGLPTTISTAALGWYQDQLFIATQSASASPARNDTLFTYDLFGNKVFKHSMNIALFCRNLGLLTFNKTLKAIENDGSTDIYIVEMDQKSATPETTFTAIARTKEFAFESPLNKKYIPYIVLDWVAVDTTQTLTVKSYGDSVLKETIVLPVPSASGFQRSYIRFKPELTKGNYISFAFSYPQDTNSANKFALLQLNIGYSVETRVE
jgi:hypothetical protein